VEIEYQLAIPFGSYGEAASVPSFETVTALTNFVGDVVTTLVSDSTYREDKDTDSGAEIIVRSTETVPFRPMITTLKSLRCAGIDSVMYIATSVDSMSSVETTLILPKSLCDSGFRSAHCYTRLLIDRDNSFWGSFGIEPVQPFDPVVNDSLHDLFITQVKGGGVFDMCLSVHPDAQFTQLLNVLDFKYAAEELLSSDSLYMGRYRKYYSLALEFAERVELRLIMREWGSRTERHMQKNRAEHSPIIPTPPSRQSPLSRITLPRFRPPVKIAAPRIIGAPKLIESK
jgi:hypothetical protein